MPYTHQRPEEGETLKKQGKKLQSNPHYWLYKVTSEALDNEDHPLRDMGHIWNRWACEKLNIEEKKELGLKDNDYPVLSDDEKQGIITYIRQKEIKIITEIRSFYQLPSLDNDIDFSRVTWQKKVNFREFIFIRRVDFCFAKFKEHINFFKAIFIYNADFEDAEFQQDVNFNATIFEKNANFVYCQFKESIEPEVSGFGGSEFRGEADFSQIVFHGYADFSDAKFKGNVTFGKAKFRKGVDFSSAKFMQDADFWSATFKKSFDLTDARFLGNVINFNKCHFIIGKSNEKEVTYKEEMKIFSFRNAIFVQRVNFVEAVFWRLPDMMGTSFYNGINLDKILSVLALKDDDDIINKLVAKVRFMSPKTLEDKEKNSTKDDRFYKKLVMLFLQKNSNMSHKDKVLGGLPTYADAEIAWHVLQTEMENAGYHKKAVQYFGYELDAQYFNPETGKIFKAIVRGYKTLSDYGKSVLHPLSAWIGAIFMFFVVYFCILSVMMPSAHSRFERFSLSAHLSLKGSVPLVSDQTTFFDRMLADPIEPESEECTRKSDYQGNVMYYVNLACYHNTAQHIPFPQEDPTKEPIPFNNILELYVFPFFYGFHTLFSLVCFFLFGLGVRNRLRLN